MENDNSTEKNEECCSGKSCLATFIFLFLVIAFIAWIVQMATNTNNTDTPTLTSRKATINDISISSNEGNIISIELIVIPKCDINDLEITINYYNDSKKLLKTTTKNFGDVKEGGRYTEQVYITDFSLSQIFNLDYCTYTVTGGTISYFQ